jgi:uncharacterized protein YecT (DUF1311 family)
MAQARNEVGAFEPATLRELAEDLTARSRGDIWSAPPQSLLRTAGGGARASAAAPPPSRGWRLKAGLAAVVAGALLALFLTPVADLRPASPPRPPAPAAPAALAAVGPLPDWVVEPAGPVAPRASDSPRPATSTETASPGSARAAQARPATAARSRARRTAPRPAAPTPAKLAVQLPAPPPPQPLTPSFDCASATGAAELRVCGNSRLAAADRAVAAAYRRAETAGVSTRRLRRQQKSWLAARDRTAEDQPEALVELYERRMDELHLQAERAEARRSR